MLISPDKSGLNTAVAAIKNGDLVAFPTDSFFALGADGLNARAVESVFHTKGRNPGTPVPLLVNGIAMAERLSAKIPSVMRSLADEFWPGALTIVVEADESVPEVVTARTGTVGLRVPDHDIAHKLIDLSGTPLTGTSCNLTGRSPLKDVADVEIIFGAEIFGCVDSPCGPNSDPSTVVSFENGAISVLRLGAISMESIRNIAGDIAVS
jgi:L-threonylcarbamoyladenylate synthase